jgi:hypothetical protein
MPYVPRGHDEEGNERSGCTVEEWHGKLEDVTRALGPNASDGELEEKLLELLAM